MSLLQAHYLKIWLPGCCWQQTSALLCELVASEAELSEKQRCLSVLWTPGDS